MTKILTKAQFSALRQYAPEVVKKIGYDASGGYDHEERSLSELREDRKAILRAAEMNLAGIEAVADDVEARSREVAGDALMELADVVDDEVDGRKNGVRLADEERRAKMRPLRDVDGGRGIDDGAPESVYETDPTPVYAIRSNQSFADHIRAKNPRSEYRGMSVGSYLRAAVVGPKTDIEKRALAEGSDGAGGYTVPELLSGFLIDRMRSKSVVSKLGAQYVPLKSNSNSIARVVSDPEPAWRYELGLVKESEPSFDRVYFEPKSLAVLVKVSLELLEDSLNIEDALPTMIATAMAQEVDRACLLGAGDGHVPKGVANFSGLTEIFDGDGEPGNYWDRLVAMQTSLRMANSDATAFVMSPRERGYLSMVKDNNGAYLKPPASLDNVPIYDTSKIPINLGENEDESFILAGDWSKLLIGVRSDFRINQMRETFMDRLTIGIIAHIRMDVACENEAAFAKAGGFFKSS